MRETRTVIPRRVDTPFVDTRILGKATLLGVVLRGGEDLLGPRMAVSEDFRARRPRRP